MQGLDGEDVLPALRQVLLLEQGLVVGHAPVFQFFTDPQAVLGAHIGREKLEIGEIGKIRERARLAVEFHAAADGGDDIGYHTAFPEGDQRLVDPADAAGALVGDVDERVTRLERGDEGRPFPAGEVADIAHLAFLFGAGDPSRGHLQFPMQPRKDAGIHLEGGEHVPGWLGKIGRGQVLGQAENGGEGAGQN